MQIQILQRLTDLINKFYDIFLIIKILKSLR